eukprot:Rhum_TRINITY_DN23259_c0_g1::Rhum_TRINITY_DN23259_c0_g1_i1::g.177558::m.177558
MALGLRGRSHSGTALRQGAAVLAQVTLVSCTGVAFMQPADGTVFVKPGECLDETYTLYEDYVVCEIDEKMDEPSQWDECYTHALSIATLLDPSLASVRGAELMTNRSGECGCSVLLDVVPHVRRAFYDGQLTILYADPSAPSPTYDSLKRPLKPWSAKAPYTTGESLPQTATGRVAVSAYEALIGNVQRIYSQDPQYKTQCLWNDACFSNTGTPCAIMAQPPFPADQVPQLLPQSTGACCTASTPPQTAPNTYYEITVDIAAFRLGNLPIGSSACGVIAYFYSTVNANRAHHKVVGFQYPAGGPHQFDQQKCTVVFGVDSDSYSQDTVLDMIVVPTRYYNAPVSATQAVLSVPTNFALDDPPEDLYDFGWPSRCYVGDPCLALPHILFQLGALCLARPPYARTNVPQSEAPSSYGPGAFPEPQPTPTTAPTDPPVVPRPTPPSPMPPWDGIPPGACECGRSLGEPYGAWYCASAAWREAGRTCFRIPPAGVCGVGYMECTRETVSPVPEVGVETGTACRCQRYTQDAYANDAVLCASEGECNLPHANGTCPQGATLCAAKKLTRLFLQAMPLMLNMNMMRATNTTFAELRVISVCPADACPSGVCPPALDSRWAAGCFAVTDKRIERWADQSVYVDFDLHMGTVSRLKHLEVFFDRVTGVDHSTGVVELQAMKVPLDGARSVWPPIQRSTQEHEGGGAVYQATPHPLGGDDEEHVPWLASYLWCLLLAAVVVVAGVAVARERRQPPVHKLSQEQDCALSSSGSSSELDAWPAAATDAVAPEQQQLLPLRQCEEGPTSIRRPTGLVMVDSTIAPTQQSRCSSLSSSDSEPEEAV